MQLVVSLILEAYDRSQATVLWGLWHWDRFFPKYIETSIHCFPMWHCPKIIYSSFYKSDTFTTSLQVLFPTFCISFLWFLQK